jgi:hypothetical protein
MIWPFVVFSGCLLADGHNLELDAADGMTSAPFETGDIDIATVSILTKPAIDLTVICRSSSW